MRTDYHMIEPNKLIILYCDDFMGDYKVEGMMIQYKDKTKKKRFCTFNKVTGKYETDSKNWSQREGWDYLSTKTEGEK